MSNHAQYNLNNNKIPHILSLAHKQNIEAFCKKLLDINLSNFVMYIIFNNKNKFVLSNIFELLIPYYTESLYKEDYSFSDEITADKSYYLCEKHPSVSNNLKKHLEERFSVYRSYYIIRRSPEMNFVFGAIKNTPIAHVDLFYNKSVQEFEDFCVGFLDEFIDLISDYNPLYKNSFAFTNATYRRSIIKGNNLYNVLTTREIDCLNLAARGNTTKQIAKLLSISPYTVDTHLKNLKQKLNCKTIQESILEGILRGYIGNIFVQSSNKEIYVPSTFNSMDSLRLFNST